jgi:hypothetical protein
MTPWKANAPDGLNRDQRAFFSLDCRARKQTDALDQSTRGTSPGYARDRECHCKWAIQIFNHIIVGSSETLVSNRKDRFHAK